MIRRIAIIILLYHNFSPIVSYGAVVNNLIEPRTYFVNHEKGKKQAYNDLKNYRTISIYGISGIGKTQFLRKFVQENKDQYEIIWFFDCNKDLNLKINCKNVIYYYIKK